MKNLMKMIIVLMMIGTQVNSLMAQSNSTGIYITAQDYKAGKLTYTDAKNLKLNQFLGGSHISLISDGKKVKLLKADVFGYRINGVNYRFYKNEAYQVLDTAGFTLYSHEQLAPQGKGYTTNASYFFSLNENTPVTALTIANINNSFAGQADFRYSLENYFHSDSDLAIYDRFNKQYEIKYLYFEHQHRTATQHASL
ncbi:hypothetical protein LX99_02220 [Mucilaginibacter oryzae]|uniref:DKNYY family protein n=1 Tax=Mucilaginibacter oryzae TaxID=468058 RepID=A0A316HCX2_9SPHI|nr:hypothetical protein [Mucilaginibacter oryzae]PWK78376.1 hypothetical protein LX99_02220 [Mucilaginibacter oryzae]